MASAGYLFSSAEIYMRADGCFGTCISRKGRAKRNILIESAFPNFSTRQAALPACLEPNLHDEQLLKLHSAHMAGRRIPWSYPDSSCAIFITGGATFPSWEIFTITQVQSSRSHILHIPSLVFWIALWEINGKVTLSPSLKGAPPQFAQNMYFEIEAPSLPHTCIFSQRILLLLFHLIVQSQL